MAQWRVVGQREFEDLRPNGQFEPMVEVTFELPAAGVQGTVRIPKREFNVDTVRAAIEADAATKAAVQDLSGG